VVLQKKGGNMKRRNWLKTVIVGVAIACLVIPLAAFGANTPESKQKSQQQWALTTGNGATQSAATAKDQSAMRKQRKALHAQKSALMKERRTLAKRGDRDGLDKNSAKLDALDAQLKVSKKGEDKI
jgi:hypothetical protein